MKHLTKRNIYIILFALLYVSVALVSTIHAFSFFALANAMGLAVLLACTFEIGQAAVLFSILTSKKDRSKVIPWILMCVLTLVQILGNVFSSYKYLITNSSSDLRFFKEPIFIWTDLPDQQCNVILTYIIGAIMPIVALLMTAMLANYLEDHSKESNRDLLNDEFIIEEDPTTTSVPETTIIPETTMVPSTEEPTTTLEPEVMIVEDDKNQDVKTHFVNI